MVDRTAEQDVSVPVLRAAWLSVAFVHWRVAPERVQRLLPPGLTVDEYDGSAWVGLTPFLMADMRPLGMPDLPGGLALTRPLRMPARLAGLTSATSTAETNLRTYVRGPDGRDGLWFLTIDVGSAAFAAAARTVVGAPYHKAVLAVDREGDTVAYTGSRTGGRQSYRLRVRPGAVVESSGLAVWLTGRWRAYTAHLGRLLVTPVAHEPWPLREAGLEELEQNLTDSVGLGGLAEPAMAHYSEGVRKVRLGPPAVLPRR